jgi:hypothetical protein
MSVYRINFEEFLVSLFLDLTSRVRVTLGLAVYRQSVCLGPMPLQIHDQNYFFNLTLVVIVLM